MKTYGIAKCKRCGEEFIKTSPNGIYCEKHRYRQSDSKIGELIECAWCGTRFFRTKNNQRCCSKVCTRKLWEKNHKKAVVEISKPQKTKSLSEVAREMREQGMTYGGREFKRFGEENESS